MHEKQQSRDEVSPTATVGTAHNYAPAQSPETKLRIMLIEDEILDGGIDDETVEVQRPYVVVVGCEATPKFHLDTARASDLSVTCVAMRARGIVGRPDEYGSPVDEDDGPDNVAMVI